MCASRKFPLRRSFSRRTPSSGSRPRACAARIFGTTLIDLVWNRKINPGKVFDLTLPLDQVAEGYRAMDTRRAIKALLHP